MVRDLGRVGEESVNGHDGYQCWKDGQECIEGDACGEQRDLVDLGPFPAALGYLYPAAHRDLGGLLGSAIPHIGFFRRSRDGRFLPNRLTTRRQDRLDADDAGPPGAYADLIHVGIHRHGVESIHAPIRGPKACLISDWLTRRGPIVPGCRSLKQIM